MLIKDNRKTTSAFYLSSKFQRTSQPGAIPLYLYFYTTKISIIFDIRKYYNRYFARKYKIFEFLYKINMHIPEL